MNKYKVMDIVWIVAATAFLVGSIAADVGEEREAYTISVAHIIHFLLWSGIYFWYGYTVGKR